MATTGDGGLLTLTAVATRASSTLDHEDTIRVAGIAR